MVYSESPGGRMDYSSNKRCSGQGRKTETQGCCRENFCMGGCGGWCVCGGAEDESADLKLCESTQRLDVRPGEMVRSSWFRTRPREGDRGQSGALVHGQGLQASQITTKIVLMIKCLHAHYISDICLSALRVFLGCPP